MYQNSKRSSLKKSKRSCELQNNPIIFIIYYHLIRRLKSSKIPKKAEYGNAHMPLRYMRTPLKGIKAELNSPRFMQQCTEVMGITIQFLAQSIPHDDMTIDPDYPSSSIRLRYSKKHEKSEYFLIEAILCCSPFRNHLPNFENEKIMTEKY